MASTTTSARTQLTLTTTRSMKMRMTKNFTTTRAGLNSEKLSNNDYPIGEVVLGIELRGHGAKGAIIDTANADFMRPGVEGRSGGRGAVENCDPLQLGRYSWRELHESGYGTSFKALRNGEKSFGEILHLLGAQPAHLFLCTRTRTRSPFAHSAHSAVRRVLRCCSREERK